MLAWRGARADGAPRRRRARAIRAVGGSSTAPTWIAIAIATRAVPRWCSACWSAACSGRAGWHRHAPAAPGRRRAARVFRLRSRRPHSCRRRCRLARPSGQPAPRRSALSRRAARALHSPGLRRVRGLAVDPRRLGQRALPAALQPCSACWSPAAPTITGSERQTAPCGSGAQPIPPGCSTISGRGRSRLVAGSRSAR